jgi:uncharacterized membrane protein HdeD (DUF308 family)
MNSDPVTTSARTATGWSMLWGVVMIICGILAIALPLASAIGVVILLGWLIAFAGVAHIVFAFESPSTGGFLWKFLLALIYGITGVYLVMNPVLGIASLTLLLSIFLLFEGVLEIVFYFNIRNAVSAGWVLFDGIITLILGVLIWAQWPASSGLVIGTLIGISLIFSGISRFVLSSAIRRMR